MTAPDAPEFEDAADELYGLHPDRFVPRRTELVKAAKAVKDKETATAIGALRKPSLGAWLANVLARESPDEVGALEELGSHLRDAQDSLSGDALRTLTKQRRDLVGALVARARKLAREDGEKVGDSVARDLEQTIAAALADPEAARAFAAGRLTTALEPGVGFEGGSSARSAGGPGTRRPPPPRGSRQAPPRRREEPEEDDGPDPAEEERARAREEAERAVERAREARDDAARAAERARHRAEQAESDLTEAADAAQSLRERLERAEAEETTAREVRDGARQAAEEADTAADEARRALDQAEAERADLE